MLSREDYEWYAREGPRGDRRYRAEVADDRTRVRPPWVRALDAARNRTHRTPFPEHRRVGLLG